MLLESMMLQCFLRIQGVVGKACIMTWARKLYSQFVNFILEVQGNIKARNGELESIKTSKFLII